MTARSLTPANLRGKMCPMGNSGGLAEAWGSRIRLSRETAGLSQSQLGRLAGVTFAAVSQWERGVRIPRDEMKVSIADALGVDVRTLFPLRGQVVSTGRGRGA